MKLSIIMISLISSEKRLKIAERAVEHLIKYSNDFEFIYVDNASPFRLKCENNVNIYIRNKNNVGITKAFNQAFKLSKGEIILFVDNDTDIKKGWQEKALKILNQHFDALSLEECKDYKKFENNTCVIKPIISPLYRDCFWLIKRRVFEKIGLFDENIFCYGEGLDFYIRMCQAGLTSAVTSDVQHYHLHALMPYISNELKNKDRQYSYKKWKINSDKEGLLLGTQLLREYKQIKN